MAGQPKSTTQTNKVELSPEQKEIFGLALPGIKEYAGKETAPYQGQRLAGFDPAETQGQELALASIPGMQGVAEGSLAAQKLLLDPGFMLNPNQYLEPAANAVRRQGRQLLDESFRNIDDAGTTAGGPYSGGSTKSGVQRGVATGRVGDSISDAIANMYLANYNQGRSLMADAAKSSGDVLRNSLMPANVASSVGAQRRLMNQAKLDDTQSQYYLEQEWPLLDAERLMGIINQMPGATGVSTAKTGGNFGSQAAGLGLTLLGTAMTGNPFLGAGIGSLGGKA